MSAGARRLSRGALAAAAVAAGVQVGPAATWLPAIRRLVPSLCGRMPSGSVALTFDDGPHPEGTPAILDDLDRLGWHATFFVLGEQARRYPEIVAETARRGHEVAVHGDRHRYAIGRTPRAVADDLRSARDTVAGLLGAAPTRWRPPYGVLSGPALVAARRLGLRPVLWSAWGRDWLADTTPDRIVATVVGEEGLDGGTLLLHDSDVMSAPGSWRNTSASLPLLAEALARRGLTVRPSLST